MKTTKNSFTWKRGLCAAAACLLLGLTACSAATPTTLNAPGAAADGNAPATTQAVTPATTPATTQALVSTDTPEDLLTTEAPAPETTEAPVEAVKANQCGENLYWRICEYGVLWIEGSGAMYDYDDKENRAPWYESRDKIDAVSLPEGLSSIGSYAFCDVPNLGRNWDPRYGGYHTFEIPDSVVSIGSHAFQNTKINNLVLPENLSSVADSTFSGCADLRELWVMNPNCVIDANQGASSTLTICGFPGSTAERFAQKSGCRFDPMIPDRDAVLEQLRAEEPEAEKQGSHATRIVAIAKCAAGYMTKVAILDPASVTEEELQQAKQTGTVVVNGEEFSYTESREQAEEWGFVSEDSEEAEGWSGWIHEDQGRFVYSVIREGDHYTFWVNGYTGSHEEVLRTIEPRNLAWFLMDDDTIVDEGIRLGEMLSHEEARFPGDLLYYPNLFLNKDGEMVVMVTKYGPKR